MQGESILTKFYYSAEIDSSDSKRILSYSFSDSWQQNKSNHWTKINQTTGHWFSL